MRVFLDANVIFSAAYQHASALLVFFELAGPGVIDLTASPFAIEEARSNIALKRPERATDCDSLVATLSIAAAASEEHLALAQAAGLLEKDRPIFAAALATEADLLVTGDRMHFGRLFGRSFGRSTVNRPAEALSAILKRRGYMAEREQLANVAQQCRYTAVDCSAQRS